MLKMSTMKIRKNVMTMVNGYLLKQNQSLNQT